MQDKMLSELDIERIKKYNTTVKGLKDKASKLRAELEFTINEVNRLCNELSKELGIEVNINNIEEIYNERVNKINETLRVGEEILNRILAEEERDRQLI